MHNLSPIIPSRVVLATYHSAAACIMFYGYHGLGTLAVDKWIRTQKGGHFQFLTVLGLIVGWLTMILSIAADLFPSVPAFRACKRALSMVSIPVAIVVASIYWTLIVFSPHLILTPELEDPSILAYLPFHIDLAMHIMPVVSLVADFVLLERKYTKAEATYGAPLVIALASIWYSWWVEYCAGYNGFFPYPFLTNNSLHIRLVIYGLTSGLALMSFWIMNACHPELHLDAAKKKL